MATFVRRTSGTSIEPPNVWRTLATWLNTWSAATHMKSGYMNSTTSLKRPFIARRPASPKKAFSRRGATDVSGSLSESGEVAATCLPASV